jgi:uncharacterized protein
MSKLFLTAEWRNLILITYKVPEEILTPHLPDELELDTIGGNAFVSLVAFDFINTRVKGRRIPFHVNFPEINLRFYVKEKESGRRGVVFIREFVPRFFISFVANRIYNEPYKSIKMKSVVSVNEVVQVKHTLKYRGREFFISAEAKKEPYIPDENSKEHFFKEHSYGYGTNRRGETLVYKVEHPVWNVYPLITCDNNVDLEHLYGTKWSFLNGAEPYSVMLAEGSHIRVFNAEKL